MLFGLFNNFIIFIFRDKWGTASLDTARYYVFPVVMIAFSYALILHAFLQNKPCVKQMSSVLLVYLLCSLTIINGSLHRYKNAELLARETGIMQSLYVNLRKAFVNYVQKNPSSAPLKIKRGNIMMPAVSRLKGVPISRYPVRSIEFYTQYVLPPSINKKIFWSDKTDPDFLQYLISKEYLFLTDGEK